MISVAIPVYEMNDQGSFFLKISLEKMTNQKFKDFEVVISDHSRDDKIKQICDFFKEKLNIVYLKNEEKRGSSSANLNNALKHCSGKLIKILMQDEYLYSENSLLDIVNAFEESEDVNWLVTNCVYGKNIDHVSGEMSPLYTDKIINGINTIGSPSVVTVKNENLEYFDEDLIWVMDCDYYKRLYDKFGKPKVLNKNCVFIVQHNDQVSNILSEEYKKNEVKILEKKFSL